MIFDSTAQIVIDSMGWFDKGALWIFDLQSQTESRIAIEGSNFPRLRAGSNGLFRLTHQSSDQAVSIRRVREPGLELASVRFNQLQPTFSGDTGLWKHVDPAVIMITESRPRLVLIDAPAGRVVDLDLSWFTSANYDLVWQGLIDCITLELTERVIVSVQRSSELVVIDSGRNERIDSIVLANRGGNPKLCMLQWGEFLASDYDTLCRVDANSLTVLKSVRLQGAKAPNTQQFIGEYDVVQSRCVVARPFSGDVLLLDLDDLRVLGHASVGGQPLAVCMISESRVVTRDWKTGRVAVGKFSSI
jgi:hypothetical protein